MEYYSVIKKEWDAICSNMMDLEIIILSEVRQRQVSLVLYTEYYICVCVYMYYIQNLKKKMKYIYKTETEWTDGYQGAKVEEQIGSLGLTSHSAMFKTDNQQAGGSVVKNLPASGGDKGLIPDPGSLYS